MSHLQYGGSASFLLTRKSILSQKRIVFNYFQYIFSDANNILPQTSPCIDLICTEKLKTKSIEVSDYKIITDLLLLNSTNYFNNHQKLFPQIDFFHITGKTQILYLFINT